MLTLASTAERSPHRWWSVPTDAARGVRELARIAVDRWAYDQQALTWCCGTSGRTAAWCASGCGAAGRWRRCPCRAGGPASPGSSGDGRRRALAAWPQGELLATLDRATGGVLGPAATRERSRLLSAWAPSTPRSYVAPRLALVGDAAHGVHPIHAQGFNMGVADVGALVDALVAARARGLDLGSGEALLPYARAPPRRQHRSACG